MDATTGSLFPLEDEAPPPSGAAPTEGPFCRVALNRPVSTEFTYRVPGELAPRVRPGVRVAVPFGRRREVGVVVGVEDTCDVEPRRLRSLAQVLDEEPVLDERLLALTRWMATHYACAWGEALAAVLPGALKREGGRRVVNVIRAADGVGRAELDALADRFEKQHRLLRTLLDIGAPTELRELCRKLNVTEAPARTLARKGLAVIEKVVVSSDPFAGASDPRPRPKELTRAQDEAVRALGRAVDAHEYRGFLLCGVTGSGKTEVYLRVIERALAAGRGAIVLVPEIALTPQTVGWFRSRFGEVAVLHSGMTEAQRLEMWMRVRHGDARVVVGARSAVFAPVRDLGVIVVDEEHEPSFKQGSVPRYHARDVALRRAELEGAVCVLGTATPSLESWHAAREGRLTRLDLPDRVRGGPMPSIGIVDMRGEKPTGRGPVLFSGRLLALLRRALERGEQAILFLNRRGFAPALWCQACGRTVRCNQCDVTLTFHRRIGRAVCHACCEEIAPPEACPTCSAPALRYIGMGSERVETSLRELLPEARIARMDSDTMHRREDYERVLGAYGRGEIDVLVGTQMIAKGLDFPNVTVVGIVAADNALYLPDFRAAERTFQLIAQVAGRAGRGSKAGEIVVQTATPEHPAIVHAARHDSEGFAAVEDALRRELGYPPHGRLLRVVIEDPEEERTLELGREAVERLRAALGSDGPTVLGPAPAPMAKLRGRHRAHILVKARPDDEGFARARDLLLSLARERQRPRMAIDVDPVSML